jgi:hypothetical protein
MTSEPKPRRDEPEESTTKRQDLDAEGVCLMVTCGGAIPVDDMKAFRHGYIQFGLPAALLGLVGLLVLQFLI